jgi:GWxTD domain-containing protein
MSLKSWTVLGAMLLLPAAGYAQQRNLEFLRDSLSRNSSVAELRKREASLKQARDAEVMMERGLVLLRLFELTNENGVGDDARDVFEKVIERAPNDAWAHFGYGLTLANGPGVRVPSPAGVLDGFVLGQSLAEVIKQDPRSRAARQFVRALELDPSLTPAAVHLAELALTSRNKDALQRSRAELQKVIAAGRSTDVVTVALSRVQSALGDVAGADATTSAVGENSSALALRARAEALLRQPDKADAGAVLYFEGVDKLDEIGASSYFEDVRIVASDRELGQWANGGTESRRAWLKHFWDVRAAASGKTVAERLSEHYRRLADAQNRFRRLGKFGAMPAGSLVQTKYDTDQLPFDERGIIYVRHGEPVNIIRTSNVDLRSNETWVYQLPNGRTQMHHFVVLRDGTDFRLVEDILQAMDPTTQGIPIEGIVKLLEDRAPYDGRYNLLANRFNQIRNQQWAASAFNSQCLAAGGSNCTGAGTAAGSLTESATVMLQMIGQTRQGIATENREAAFAALASDTDRPVFDGPLPFYYDVYTFKGADAKTDLTAAVAIPGSSLTPKTLGNSIIYSLKLSLMVIDTVFGQVTRMDTTYNFRSARTLGEQEHLRIHAGLAAAASKSTIHRLVVRDLNSKGKGQMYGGQTLVPPYIAPGLMISDVVLAEPDSGAWRRGDANLGLVPPRQFPEGEPLTLFYELYNLPANTPYRTEVTLAPTTEQSGFGRLKKLFGGSDGTIRLRFDGTARVDGSGNVQELRRVGNVMNAGKYKVAVRVTNLASQQTALGETEFIVIERKK